MWLLVLSFPNTLGKSQPQQWKYSAIGCLTLGGGLPLCLGEHLWDGPAASPSHILSVSLSLCLSLSLSLSLSLCRCDAMDRAGQLDSSDKVVPLINDVGGL